MGEVAVGGLHASLDMGFGLGDLDSMIRAALAADRDIRDAEKRAKIPRITKLSMQGETDSSGDVTISSQGITAPVGYRLNLHRIVIDYVGSDTTATKACQVRCFMSAYSNSTTSQTEQFMLGAALPTVGEWSNPQVAPIALPNEMVTVQIIGGPASTQINVGTQFTLTADLRS